MKATRNLFLLCGLLGATTLAAQAQNQFPSPDSGPYSYGQNQPSYIPGVVGTREGKPGIYNTLQRGELHDFQCVYTRATSYDKNVATFHWTKPVPRRNGALTNPAATNYVIIVQTGSPALGYDTDNIDYSTTYITDIPAPYPAGDGTINPASEVFRRTPYACPACGPLNAPRRYFVLKTGSYLTNPNDTTATLTNAVVGERYIVTRFDYIADANGIPTNPNLGSFLTHYRSRPIYLSIPHATPTITGVTTDISGRSTVTWSMAVEDPQAHGVTSGTTAIPVSTPHSYTVRINEDDSVTTATFYMQGQAAFVHKPFAVGRQYGPPTGYQSSTSAPVLASTTPTAATYSFTFDRATDIRVRKGHYYSFQVTSNDASYGQYAGDSPTSRAITPSDPTQWLAVNLTDFSATRASGSAVNLTWATSRELDNSGFEVQRSADGITWTKIAFLPGSTLSVAPRQYSYQDTFSPTAYYRLAQLNGKQLVTTYSGAQLVAAATALATVDAAKARGASIYPNPASGGRVTLTGFDPQQPLQVRNPLGQLVRQLPAGTRDLDVSTQAPGVYLVQQGASTQRLVIQ